jgi:hypothetical protein
MNVDSKARGGEGNSVGNVTVAAPGVYLVMFGFVWSKSTFHLFYHHPTSPQKDS